jgi:hypothetical protein
MSNDTDELILVTTKPCGICGKTTAMHLSQKDLNAWRDGMSVQEAFPYLSPASRELILTGTHNNCWPRMAGDAA